MQFTEEKKTLAGLVQFCTIGSTLLLAWFDTFPFFPFQPSVNPLVQILRYLSQTSFFFFFLSHIPAENPLKNVLA